MSLKINITQQELLEMRAFTTRELRLKAMEILKSIGVPLSEPNIVDMVNGLVAKIQKHKAGAVLAETESNKQYNMKKSQLQQLIREEISKVLKEPTKQEILSMSEGEIKDMYGVLEVKGTWHGKKGTFHHFKKNMFGDVTCSFRTDDLTPSGLKRNTLGLKVKSSDVKFN
jgi:hypothetical protein